jgi:methionyl-tRNA formyltransferase
MRMVAALDAGPILRQQSCPIHPQDTGGSLHDRLAKLGAEALIAVIDRLAHGAPVPETAQDENSVCYASKIEKSERQLNWSEPAIVLERKIRALLPAPAATAEIMGNICKVLGGELVPGQGNPGEVLHCGADGLTIATAEQALRITRLQPPGKRPMGAAEYYRGRTRP